jgi:hypothetical protein
MAGMDTRVPPLAELRRNFEAVPLEFEGHTSEFYVGRVDDPLRRVRMELLSQTSPAKFLVAGHRGCGKSTELNRLVAREDVRSRFEIVKFSAEKELDLVDLDYIDLLFFTAARVFDQLVGDGDGGIELDEATLKRLDDWRQLVMGNLVKSEEDEVQKKADAEAGAGVDVKVLKVFFARFQGRIAVERTTREITRRSVEPRLSDFLQTLDDFYQEIDLALAPRRRRLLLVIEDLDKIPELGKAQALFHDKGAHLARIPCSTIYTVPIALHYDPVFPKVAHVFGESVYVPNIPLRHQDGSENPEGVRLMREFILRRLPEERIAPEALDAAVQASGGIFMQLQRLMALACLQAMGSDEEQVLFADVEAVALDLRFEFERSLASRHYPILDHVDLSGAASTDADSMVLLHNLHLVEYRNRERWCMVNPLLNAALARWRALRDRESSPTKA